MADGDEERAMEELKVVLHSFYTEGRKKGLGVTPRKGDVFICTSPKAGTTWMQQICHQLRTNGDMSFEEISNVVPWLETCEDIGIDVNGEQVTSPRLFKTHAWRPHLNTSEDAKYILITRNPEDSAISFYNFLNGWFFKKDSISLDKFLDVLFLKRGEPQTIMNNPSYWHFLLSWWPHRNDENVLWLWYEDMKTSHREVVQRVATFLGFDASDADLIEIATKRSTFDYMKEHERQYDEHVWKAKNNVRVGLPEDAGLESSKVMNGGRRKVTLPTEILQRLDAKWKELVTPVTGYATYSDMKANEKLL
mmetsp:Transcript_2634/g.6189  ORF Transcript_2634/g.6189 Transcript_2634/m.6189 type:complete len:307 (-) Transcript_2634:109-1029(-)